MLHQRVQILRNFEELPVYTNCMTAHFGRLHPESSALICIFLVLWIMDVLVAIEQLWCYTYIMNYPKHILQLFLDLYRLSSQFLHYIFWNHILFTEDTVLSWQCRYSSYTTLISKKLIHLYDWLNFLLHYRFLGQPALQCSVFVFHSYICITRVQLGWVVSLLPSAVPLLLWIPLFPLQSSSFGTKKRHVSRDVLIALMMASPIFAMMSIWFIWNNLKYHDIITFLFFVLPCSVQERFCGPLQLATTILASALVQSSFYQPSLSLAGHSLLSEHFVLSQLFVHPFVALRFLVVFPPFFISLQPYFGTLKLSPVWE